MLEDKLLIFKLNQGKTEVLHRIYEKYKNQMLTLATALLNDISSAEDTVHDVFVSLINSSVKLRLDSNLKAYLSTCVANKARNKNRYSSRRPSVSLDQAEPVPVRAKNPEENAVFGEKLWLLNWSLSQLPYEQREVIMLHEYGGMKFKEIAQSQDASINTVQGRYRYGLNKLRSLLNSEVEK
jgi:RNA polymerase sigma-70 factor (ECF subfamily)